MTAVIKDDEAPKKFVNFSFYQANSGSDGNGDDGLLVQSTMDA